MAQSPICIYRFYIDAGTGKHFFENVASDFLSDAIAEASAENISVLYPVDHVYVYDTLNREVLHLYINGVKSW